MGTHNNAMVIWIWIRKENTRYAIAMINVKLNDNFIEVKFNIIKYV